MSAVGAWTAFDWRKAVKAITKLKSNIGASISFALLLFLVCAVVGSVVLAAGTAASGRISELAEADQRYYSVTSAAELLKDTLDGQTHEVVRSKITHTSFIMVYIVVDLPLLVGPTCG